MSHLLDGDVASNTLSWRWVAGLHTKGKHYLASASNIKKFTQGRFSPVGQLQEKAAPLAESGSAAVYIPTIDFPFRVSEHLSDDFALLLSGDDLSPEIGYIAGLKPKHIVVLDPANLESSWESSATVLEFRSAAIADAAHRAQEHFQVPITTLTLGSDAPGALSDLMTKLGLKSLVYYEPFIGPWKQVTASLSSRDVGITFFPLRRTWDGLLHPHAIKGYFHFKKYALPQVTRTKGNL